MTWRVAKCLDVLLAEVNAKNPNRSKTSDGSIGDAAHSSRRSDHNPNSRNVVCARDITAAGIDASALTEHLRLLGRQGDKRVGYLIFNRRICSSIDNWVWRTYNGKNPHVHHFHISTSQDPHVYDSTGPWGWQGTLPPIERFDMTAVVKREFPFADAYDFRIQCGADGKGYNDLKIPAATVISSILNCADPQKPGGWASPAAILSRCAVGGGITRIRAEGASPNALLDVTTWATK